MLKEVEAKLAELTELPTQPVYVEADPGLRPNEIQSTVRAQWFNGVKRCYEELLKTAPAAAGSIKASFAINGDGKVENARVDADDASLSGDFLACVKPGLQGLAFPGTGVTKTVTYPVKLSP
jgi:hypothetical protein